MKAKSFVACALTAAAFPLATALAQNAQPSGPQGTGWYGAPNAALPVPQPVVPYTYEPYTYDSVNWGSSAETRFDERVADMRRPDRQRWVYQGNSFDTNPPVPAP